MVACPYRWVLRVEHPPTSRSDTRTAARRIGRRPRRTPAALALTSALFVILSSCSGSETSDDEPADAATASTPQPSGAITTTTTTVTSTTAATHPGRSNHVYGRHDDPRYKQLVDDDHHNDHRSANADHDDHHDHHQHGPAHDHHDHDDHDDHDDPAHHHNDIDDCATAPLVCVGDNSRQLLQSWKCRGRDGRQGDLDKNRERHPSYNNGGQPGDSGVLAAGGSYIVTFNSEGQFAYVCTIHASMKGTITVNCP